MRPARRHGRPSWILLTGTLLLLLALLIGLLAQQFLANQDTAAAEIPAAIPYVDRLWEVPVVLPTYLPACVNYRENGAEIIPAVYTGDGRALRISFEAVATPECHDAPPASIELIEAPALYTLQGEVTTVTKDRLQFARVAEMTTSGATRLTFQWLCGRTYCRLSGTLSDSLTESDLLSMAASVREIER